MFNREYYNLLSEKDKLSAQQIEYFSSEIPMLSIHELAARLFLSPASLSRLVKKLGYQNYKEFRNSFAVPMPQTSFAPSSNLKRHIDIIFQEYPYPLQNCVVPHIKTAKSIYVIAFGGSSGIGQELTLALNSLNYNSVLIHDSDLIPIVESNITADDLIIYISYSGSNVQMCDLAISQKYSNHQILLTSSFCSPLSTHVSLIINTHTEKNNFDFQTRLPLCALVNLLITNLDINI